MTSLDGAGDLTRRAGAEPSIKGPYIEQQNTLPTLTQTLTLTPSPTYTNALTLTRPVEALEWKKKCMKLEKMQRDGAKPDLSVDVQQREAPGVRDRCW